MRYSNPGATLLADGSTLLLCRVEDRRGHSHLGVARSMNGRDRQLADRRQSYVHGGPGALSR